MFARYGKTVAVGIALLIFFNLLGGVVSAKSNTTIVYWIWDSIQEPATEQLIEAFQKNHPDVQVHLEVVPWGDYWNKLLVALAGGAGPDVFWNHIWYFNSLVTQGALLDLTPYLTRDPDAMADFRSMFPLTQRIYTYNERIYGIPRDFDVVALYYNADAMEEAGLVAPAKIEATWDWNTFATYAQKLTKRKDNEMVRAGYSLGPWGQGIYYNWIWSNKGEIFSADGKRSTLSSPPVVQALQYLADLQLKLRVTRWSSVPSGEVAMETHGSWVVKYFREQSKFNWDVAEVPFSPYSKARGTTMNSLANSVNARSKNADAAVKFVKFLGTREAGLVLAASNTVMPSRQDAVTSYFQLQKGVAPANLAAFARAANYGHSLPVSPYVSQSSFEPRIDAAVASILDGSQSVEKALKEAEEEINVMINAALAKAGQGK